MKNTIDPNEYQDPRLKELLELLEPVPPRSAAEEMDTRKRFMAELDEIFAAAPVQPQSRIPKWLAALLPAQRLPGSSPRRFAFSTVMALIAIFALLFGGAGATALAAQSSIPGDVLYPVKTGLEGAQLTLAADAYAQAQLHLSFAQRRLDEVAGLIQAGRTAEINAAAAEFQRQIDHALEKLGILAVNDPARAADLARQITLALSQYAQVLSGLTAQAPEIARPALQQALQSTAGQALPGEIELIGVVESMAAGMWTVAGQSVAITPATEIKGSIQIGDTVKVHAIPTAGGAFTAREIELSAAATGNENDNAANDNLENSGSENDDSVNENENLNENENQDDNENENEDNTNGVGNDNESSQHGGETRFVGVVESISATSITVSGLTLTITSQTELDSSIAVGDTIEVRGVSGLNGRLIAVRLRLEGQSSGGSQQNENSNSGSGSGSDDSSNQDSSGNSNSGDDSSGNSNDSGDDNSSGSGSGRSGGSNKNDNSSNDNNDNGGGGDNDNG